MVPTVQACLSMLKLSVKMSDWAFAAKLVGVMQQGKMELPKKVIEESLAIRRNSEEFEEYEKLWGQITDLDGEDQQEPYNSTENYEKTTVKREQIRLGKDALRLPLSFQLIVVPEGPQSEGSDDSGPESGEEGNKGDS